MCETTFGFDPNLRDDVSGDGDGVSSRQDDPDDLSCFSQLENPIMEYRYHVEELGRLEVRS